MPLPVNDAKALSSHAADETDMDEDGSLIAFLTQKRQGRQP